MKRNKYGNTKTTIDGIKFDSKIEAAYYKDLKILKKAGEIIDFKCQPEFVLQEGYRDHDKKWIRPIKYRADFAVYWDGGTEIVDVKGVETATFKIKWKLLKYHYRFNTEYRFTIAK